MTMSATAYTAAALMLALYTAAGAASEQVTAIVSARVPAPFAGTPIEDATIIMRDGRIVAVGAALVPPAGAHIVDAAGRIVTPGLMNAGTQIGLMEVAWDDDNGDERVDSGPLGASFDIQYAIDANSLTIQQARAAGLSRAMVFPGGAATGPFSGLGAVLHLRPGAEVLERPAAAMYVVVGSASAAHAGGSRSAQWILLRNALDEARRQSSRNRALPADERLLSRLDLEALQPVLAGTIPLAIVAQRESDLRQALRLREDFGLRVVIVGGAEAWRVAAELASTGTPVVLDPLAGLPMSFDELGARRDNAAVLQRAGVKIAFSVPGAGIYLSYAAGTALREAAGVAVANGLPYAEALWAITRNAAQIWGVAEQYGTLEPGRDADLVIWDGDPLEPSSAPAVVLVGGHEISLRTRQTELRDRYRPVRTTTTAPAVVP